ncbi:MAG TPA: L-seryl-tRNA(Sec) selenium transferase [Thermoanaerobaculia bacterium]|nr:L-seryl-tRNA(Sec) selenium transferase [Thermoanaerobaculia bacterium]
MTSPTAPVAARTHPPSMDALLKAEGAGPVLDRYGREAVKEELRRAMSGGASDPEALWKAAREALARRFAPTLCRAINATGVLLHTNLGRAPLPASARAALQEAAAGYATVEYDPERGGRGKRQDHVRALARELFACGDALAVNNNAAAVLLALAALARGKEVLVSRGELVAIGGSFKIPEILEASGARLREVGTTNRTTPDDYRRAFGPEVALLLSVHPSNYEIRGYTRRPAPHELALLSREAGVPWLHDQGTGAVVPLDAFGVADEPTVAECLDAGADLVTFSGDKLFSGPQAGLLVGRADLVGRAAAHPIARAVRPDKLTLAALSATLADWKTGAWRSFPVYRAAAASLESLEARGARLLAAAAAGSLDGAVVPSQAAFGGGTSPEKLFPSRALALSRAGQPVDALAARLRARRPPIVGRVENGRLLLDLRSIFPEEDALVEEALSALAAWVR